MANTQQSPCMVIEELTNERNETLPEILSSFDTETEARKLLNNSKMVIKFLRLYKIEEVDESILQHVIPVVKCSIEKIYEDNSMLSDTSDDEFIQSIIKENIEIALQLLQILKTILEFLMSNSDNIAIRLIPSVSTNLGNTLFITFEHCKKGPNIYKNSFNSELLELFRIAQEVHLLYLKLFSSFIVVDIFLEQELATINNVLKIIGNISEILHGMNIKLMTGNWKGFLSIAQKFSSSLADSFDVSQPIFILTKEINKNLTSLINEGECNSKTVVPTVNVTAFLVKVALKLFEIFWIKAQVELEGIARFICVIQSFPLDLFKSEGFSDNIMDSINDSLKKPVENLIIKLVNEKDFIRTISQTYSGSVVFLDFINCILEAVINNVAAVNDVSVLTQILNTIFKNFTISCCSSFDDLVVNTAALVLIFNELNSKIELILLKNVLQDEDCCCALFVIEVWCLLLRNSSSSVQLDTLNNLISKTEHLQLGTFTHRPMKIYLKILIQRIFKMLPAHMKNNLIEKLSPQSWNLIELECVQQKYFIEKYLHSTIEKVELIGNKQVNLNDFVIVVENLGIISTLNCDYNGPNLIRLTCAVINLWEFNISQNILGNNLFKYFIFKLIEVTKFLMPQLNSEKLIIILSQLTRLSTESYYKPIISEFLLSLPNYRIREHGQELNKILALISNIIYPNLLKNSNHIIKQNTLEGIQQLQGSEKFDCVIKTVMQNSNDVQGEIYNYLHKIVTNTELNELEYLTILNSYQFKHKCVEWNRNNVYTSSKPQTKKFKAECKTLMVSNTVDVNETPKIEAMEVCEDDDATEVLSRIKNEMKCFGKIVKTEQLTRKNITDIKLIINQLQNYL